MIRVLTLFLTFGFGILAQAQEVPTPVAPAAPPMEATPVAATNPQELLDQFFTALKQQNYAQANSLLQVPMSPLNLQRYENQADVWKEQDAARLQLALQMLQSLQVDFHVPEKPVAAFVTGQVVETWPVRVVYSYLFPDALNKEKPQTQTEEVTMVVFKDKAGNWKLQGAFLRGFLELVWFADLS